jgi:hypothetical protein
MSSLWMLYAGTDHLFVAMGDHGLCESPRREGIPPALESAIVLSNWGLTTDTMASGLHAYMDKGPCFRPGQVDHRPGYQDLWVERFLGFGILRVWDLRVSRF